MINFGSYYNMEKENKTSTTLPCLAIIVPCYNEKEVLEATDSALQNLLINMEERGIVNSESFIIYVDDGSKDDTWELICNAVQKHPRSTKGIKLAHNAGHQNALLAGISSVADICDAAVTIDADLQDDIEAIPKMAEKFREGYEIVYGVRDSRETDTWFKKNSALFFYKTMKALGVETVYNHADFRLMSSRALKELMKYKETNIFLRGVVPQIGLKNTTVSYNRKARLAGESKYPLKKMINFAVEGITSFSMKPVRMVFMIGMIFLLITLAIFIYTLIRYFTNETIEGWTSLMLSIWFCTGVLLVSLGVIGEYVGKIFLEVKERPRFNIEEKEGF